MAQLSGRGYEQVRVAILEFLDTGEEIEFLKTPRKRGRLGKGISHATHI